MRFAWWVSLLACAGRCWAATYTLESPAISLTFTTGTHTFDFGLVNKSTGQSVLAENSTLFGGSSVRGSGAPTAGVDGLGRSYLEFPLTLNGGGSATARYTLYSPTVVRVDLSAGGAASIGQYFTNGTSERYYGTFQTTYLKNLNNAGLSAKPYRGYFESVDSDKTEGARAPFYFTSRNVGVYTHTNDTGNYSFGASAGTGFTFNTSAGSLQYDLIVGSSPKNLIQQHNALAGPAFMPPDWAFTSIWWRDDFHQIPADANVSTAQALVLKDADMLRQFHIPSGAIWIDRPYGSPYPQNAPPYTPAEQNVGSWGNMDFDPASFPTPAAMISGLRERGLNLLVWAANKANNNLRTEGRDLGYLFASPDYTDCPAIDLSNPAAYQWFQGELDALVAMGIKGYKIDRGGEGEMPAGLTNLLPYLFHKLAAEGMAARNGTDFFNFSRNLHDQSRQYAAVWNGDTQATFTGLQTSVKQVIRAGLINFPIWGSDTGGYTGGVPTKELFARWMGFSAYCPMMEVLNGPNRNVWYTYDTDPYAAGSLVQITAKHTQAHHDLIPYVRSGVYEALSNGTPVVRAMMLEFPSDPTTWDMADQYMYGPSILVAPVTTAGVTSRSVYLPAGRWLEYNGKTTVYAGGQTITAAAPLDTVPLFVREGAIVPRGDIVRVNNNWTANWAPSLRIENFPSSSIDGIFDYYTGAGATPVQTLRSKLDGHLLRFTFGDLRNPGTAEMYLGRFFTFTGLETVRRNGATLAAGTDYTFDPATNVLLVPFDGAADIQVRLAPSSGLNQWNTAAGGTFGDTTRWTQARVPGGTDAVADFMQPLSSPATVTVGSPVTVGAVYFKSPAAYTLSGAGGVTLRSNGAAIVESAQGTHSLATRVTLASDTQVIAADGAAIEIAGVLDNSAGKTLTKSGRGTLRLANDNLGAGLTRVAEGTLIAAHDRALGTSAVVVGDSATGADAGLYIQGNHRITNHITIDGGAGLCTIGQSELSGVAEFAGTLTLLDDVTIHAWGAGEVTLSGLLDNSAGHSIRFDGDGTLNLNGPMIHGPGAMLIIGGMSIPLASTVAEPAMLLPVAVLAIAGLRRNRAGAGAGAALSRRRRGSVAQRPWP